MAQQKSSARSGLIRTIAVAADFGPSSSHALALATTMAKKLRAELSIVHVVEPSPLGADLRVLEELGRGALNATVTRVRDDVSGARGVLLVGHTAEQVSSFVDENAIDLVVTGTHGPKALERWFLGSVAVKIVRACPTVVTVHQAAQPFRRILIATDFGRSSERALELAARMAKAYGATLTLLHVVDDYTPLYSADAIYVNALGPSLDELERASRKQLEEAACQLSELVPDPSIVVLRGKPWVEITGEAAKGQYDLLVVGTHGRGAISRWLLGSVAEKVVRAALPPVLTVRGDGG